MDRKVPDAEEKKKTTKTKSSSSCYNPFRDRSTPIIKMVHRLWPDINSMEIEELNFGDSVRTKICLLLLQVFLIFCNKN